MNIEQKDYEISIIINKCDKETIKQFIIDYAYLYSQLKPIEKSYKLRFIQKDDLDFKTMTLLTLALYNNFKKVHSIYIESIEFCVKSKVVKNLLNNCLELYPTRQPHIVTLLEEN